MNSGFSETKILRRLGMKVAKNLESQLLAVMKQDPGFQKYYDKILGTMNTMINEDDFLESICSSHQSISEIPENQKVIQRRDNTFIIRAINPDNIKSLTQRAFFNSFNLERNVLNDLDEENKNNRGPFRRDNRIDSNRYPTHHQNQEGQEEAMCICGKNILHSQWVECKNQKKCRGSDWYHLECAGIDPKEFNNLKDRQFTCERCKRQFDDDESVSQSRKRIKDDVSV